ncbi:hypothetical protein C0993_007308 [Termitomyces sp. T159_Od127]|nr:hypothetical protein C0993_007308 [Termitomyces sp. T159_Od127]
MKLANRTFIVSGGSSGLGLATVLDLLAANACVSILDRSPPPESASLPASHTRYIQTDITDVRQIQEAVDTTVQWTSETQKPLGGVINCAGVGTAAKILNSSNEPHDLDLWDFAIAVNLTGSFNLTRLVLPHLVKVKPEDTPDGERGVVIFVSSAAAYEGQPGQTAYSATKGALRSMTLPMARDLARHAVRVVTIAPGVFASSMTVRMPGKTKNSLESGIVYPQRFGQPTEFARTVRWILDCAYVNGETIRLSGAGRLPAKLSSGLGLATVQDLLEGNAYVAVVDISPLPVVLESSTKCMYVQTDLRELAQIEHAVKSVVEWTQVTDAELGGVINSAGLGRTELMINAKGRPHGTAVWDLTMGTNLTGSFNLTRLVLEHLVRVKPEDTPDGERGVIILIASEAAFEGQPGQTAYAASKGAVRSMTLPMARELARHHVRVVTIAPGPFTTPLIGMLSNRVHAALHSNAVLYPKRFGMPAELAKTVRWILECAYVNGETIRLTGGCRIPAYL